MRLPRSPADAALLSAFLFPLLAAAGTSFDCDHIRTDGMAFNLAKLGGARSVMHPFENHNTTYTINICGPLGKVRELPAAEQCPHGTQVCAIRRTVTDGSDVFDEAFPIAGELKSKGGKDLDAQWTRLQKSDSHTDSEKEGLRVTMNGGFRRLEGGGKRNQKAIVEFLCDKTRTGLENLYDPKEKYSDDNDNDKVKREEESGSDEDSEDSKSSSLQFVRYEAGDGEGEVDILRLSWRTQYACEDSKDEQDNDAANRWGFFTWFIIIAFLSTATYLIFGSWLNYNRYGARGWDLLPHGDTIRDVPYLFKDWMRRVLNTIQGGGTRGGYAAV